MADGTDDVADTVNESVAVVAEVVVLLVPELTAPGPLTWSTSWVPSAIGPLGFAGQEPAGLSTDVMPNGMVPFAPTLRFPAKVV